MQHRKSLNTLHVHSTSGSLNTFHRCSSICLCQRRKRDWASTSGTRRDFFLGCPLAAAALSRCWVDTERWVQPHFSVCASFLASRWSAKLLRPVPLTPLWPASWVAAVDKTRNSKSALVRNIWEIYDKSLELIPAGHALAIRNALMSRDKNAAWAAWSSAAEWCLSDAFNLAGGQVPPGSLVWGRGSAWLRENAIGGSKMRRLRHDLLDPCCASEVYLYRNDSIAPLLSLRSRLRAILCLIELIALSGFTIERALQPDRQWSAVLRDGLVGVLDWDYLVGGSLSGLDEFCTRVIASIAELAEFLQQVVVHRRDHAVRRWRAWVLEDPLVHPYRWLRLMISLLLHFSPVILVTRLMGLGCWWNLMPLTSNLGKPKCPFSAVGKG